MHDVWPKNMYYGHRPCTIAINIQEHTKKTKLKKDKKNAKGTRCRPRIGPTTMAGLDFVITKNTLIIKAYTWFFKICFCCLFFATDF